MVLGVLVLVVLLRATTLHGYVYLYTYTATRTEGVVVYACIALHVMGRWSSGM